LKLTVTLSSGQSDDIGLMHALNVALTERLAGRPAEDVKGKTTTITWRAAGSPEGWESATLTFVTHERKGVSTRTYTFDDETSRWYMAWYAERQRNAQTARAVPIIPRFPNAVTH
jgi:hypothetical protein